jgi:hypothetical protein
LCSDHPYTGWTPTIQAIGKKAGPLEAKKLPVLRALAL